METKKKRSRTVTWEDPFLAMQAAPGKTGLQLLKEVFEGRLPPPPITQALGFTGTHVEEGKAIFEGDPDESLYNPIGVVHGGFAMTLLDSAMACAVHSTLAAGERYTTLEVKTNFVRPITVETGRVRCEGVVIHRGGTVATAEARLVVASSGKLLAHATTTCLIIK
jgi:uncharacterized protein (TIGR00369 family)